MRRYWIPNEFKQGQVVHLSGEVLHHIRDVCRMRIGSRFEVMVDGLAFLVEISNETKHESVASIIEERKIAPRPKPDLILVMAVPRFPVFEAVMEKAVELGVARIQPVFSDFSFIRTQDHVFEGKRARWAKIITGATQQSGRGDLMPIAPLQSLKTYVETFNRSAEIAGLFAYEGEGVLTARQALPQMGSPQDVHIFVGSEGGFSQNEVTLFQQFGLHPVTLGSQVLRVETACVALVSILQYYFSRNGKENR